MSARSRAEPWFRASVDERFAVAEAWALLNRERFKYHRPENSDMTWRYARRDNMGPPLALSGIANGLLK